MLKMKKENGSENSEPFYVQKSRALKSTIIAEVVT